MQPSQWPLPPPVMKWVGKSYPTLHKDPGNRPHTTGHRTTHRQTPGPLPTDACITPRSTASPQHCGHHHTCECQRHTQTASQHISTTQTHTHTHNHTLPSQKHRHPHCTHRSHRHILSNPTQTHHVPGCNHARTITLPCTESLKTDTETRCTHSAEHTHTHTCHLVTFHSTGGPQSGRANTDKYIVF